MADQPQSGTPNKHCGITLIVVATIAFVTVMYALTLSVCAVFSISPPTEILSQYKEISLVALGAIASILARTRPDVPTDVNVTNPPSDPVPTQPQAQNYPLDTEG